MESENFKKDTLPVIPEPAEKAEEKDKAKEKIFIVGGDLAGLGLSERDLHLVLGRLNQLHDAGVVSTVEEARAIVPKIDISELMPESKEDKKEKPKPPRHTKKKGERY